MCEPLKRKVQKQFMGRFFNSGDVKSAVKGLIEYHEDNIEGIIKRHSYWNKNYASQDDLDYFFELLREQYDSIIVIEHWLEDAIKKKGRKE